MKNKITLFLLLFVTLLPKQIFADINSVEQKLRIKIDEVFAHTPKLSEIYRNVLDNELTRVQDLPGYDLLLRSKELKALNNSPEMQEYMKELTRSINTEAGNINGQIVAIDEQTKQLKKALNDQDLLEDTGLSVREVQEKINLNNITRNRLKTQAGGALQSLNGLPQLYFTATEGLNSLGELTPVQRPDTSTTDMLLASIANIDRLIDTRIDYMLLEALGIASGEEVSSGQGLWVKGLKSYAKQGGYKLTPGYKLNQNGLAIGIDFIENPSIWGISYSFTSGDLSTNIPNTKEKINSHIANIYGLYGFTDNLFIDMQARYGKSYINKSRNNLNLSNDISYAKTSGDLYGGKLELGYSYNLQEKLNMIPSIGISYDEIKINGYKERGTGFNRKIAARTVNKTSGIFGLKLSNDIAIGPYSFIPEIHAKLFRALNTNNDNTVITFIDGVSPLVTPSGKLPVTSYNIGLSSKITKLQALDLTLGYDAGFSKKFHSHTGYFSAKIIF